MIPLHLVIVCDQLLLFSEAATTGTTDGKQTIYRVINNDWLLLELVFTHGARPEGFIMILFLAFFARNLERLHDVLRLVILRFKNLLLPSLLRLSVIRFSQLLSQLRIHLWLGWRRSIIIRFITRLNVVVSDCLRSSVYEVLHLLI